MVKKVRKKILKLSKTRRHLQNKEDPVNLISQEEDHLFLGMKRHSMVIVIFAINLGIGLLIANLGVNLLSLELEV